MKISVSLHNHTIMSDGELSPDELLLYLKDCGYDVIAITDHMNLTIPWKIPDDIIFMPGIEWYSPRGYEIACINPHTIPEVGKLDLSQTELKWIAHPMYSNFGRYSGTSFVMDMLSVLMNNRLDGYELYNRNDLQISEADYIELHNIKSIKINEYAVDDFHVKGQEFTGWIEMKVPELEYSEVMKNLLSGNYDIKVDESK